MNTLRIIKDALVSPVNEDVTISKDHVHTEGYVTNFMLSTLHDIISFHCDLIEKAEDEILLTTSYWENKSLSAHMLCKSLKKLVKAKPHIRIRLVIDNGTVENIFAKHYTREVNVLNLGHNANVKTKSVHVPLLGTMHAKFMLVDRRTAILSSNNVQDRPNVELAISMMGDVCKGFFDIFRRLWKDDVDLNDVDSPKSVNLSSSCPSSPSSPSSTFPMIFTNRKSHGGVTSDIRSPQNCAWWTMMSCANSDIFITTPTFNASHAIEAVYLACKRGIKVTLVLTKNFNDKKEALPFQGGTNNYAVNRLRDRLRRVKCEGNLHVRWYVGRNERRPKKGVHSHVKFISIDHNILMFGNGNMDTQSWYHSMEVNIIVPSSYLCRELEYIMTKYSQPF